METLCLYYQDIYYQDIWPIESKRKITSIIVEPRHPKKFDNKDRRKKRRRSKVGTVSEITSYNR
jgi:hypothetical protein